MIALQNLVTEPTYSTLKIKGPSVKYNYLNGHNFISVGPIIFYDLLKARPFR